MAGIINAALKTQLENAYNSGDTNTVQGILHKNKISDAQIASTWGDSVVSEAAGKGIYGYNPKDTVGTARNAYVAGDIGGANANIQSNQITRDQALGRYTAQEVAEAEAKGVRFFAPPPATPRPATPSKQVDGGNFKKWEVTPQQTVQQQAYDVIAKDSPLMQQARGGAMQQMNERGLINSSLAAQASQDAVMGRALQIAAPDAQTYARAGEFNSGQQNAWNLAQQELDMRERQFGQELAFKYDELSKSQDNKLALMEAEQKYSRLMANDEAFNKQYAMYVDALYQIDKDPNLSAEAKQAAKFQQARMLEDYANLRGLNLNLNFSSRFTPGAAPAPAPQPNVGIIGSRASTSEN